MNKWEYYTITGDPHGINDGTYYSLNIYLNAMGEQGWELIEAVVFSSSYSSGVTETSEVKYIFKRPKPVKD